jgi:parvulin-like peptidyl-prolyl isomerase
MKKSFEESKKVLAAKVNNEPITMFSLLREMNAIAPQYVASGKQRTPEIDAKIRSNALNTLIIQELAVQEARKRGMKVRPDLIDNTIRKMQTDAKSVDAYQKELSRQGMSEDELRKSLEQDNLFELIAAQEIDAKIKVSDQELRKRYEKEKLKNAAHGQMTFEQAKGMLEQKARAEAGERRMREWETELKKTARIEVFEQKKANGVK